MEVEKECHDRIPCEYYFPNIKPSNKNAETNGNIVTNNRVNKCVWKIKLIKILSKYYSKIRSDFKNKWDNIKFVKMIDSWLMKNKIDINKRKWIQSEILATKIICILCSEDEAIKNKLILGECLFTIYKFFKLTNLHNFDSNEGDEEKNKEELKYKEDNLHKCLESKDINNFDRGEYLYFDNTYIKNNDEIDLHQLYKHEKQRLCSSMNFIINDKYKTMEYINGVYYIPIG